MDRADLDYAGLFDASPNPYLVLDRALNIVGANRAYLRATKRDLADLVGRWAWNAFPTDPETQRQSLASLERVLRTGQPDTIALLRFDIPRPDAEGGGFEERYWSIVHAPVLDAAGEVALVLQHPIDVTELQRLRVAARYTGEERRLQMEPAQSGIFGRAEAVYQANLSLHAEGDRLRGLFEQAPGFMCVLRGPEHRFELANAAYLQLVGRRELLGRPVREALPELEGQGFFELLDRVYAAGEAFTVRRAPITLASGPGNALDRRFVDFVYQPIRDTAGTVSGIFVEGSDVTEAALAEEALRASEAQFRSVLHQLPVGVAVADAANRVIYANPALERILRHPTLPSPGVQAYGEWDIRHPDGRPYALRDHPLARGLNGESVEQELARYRRGDGAEAWIRLSSIPLRDGAGRITGALAIVLDVDEAERARLALARQQGELARQVEERTAELMAVEAVLRQSQKMDAVGQLTGGIAHDFNNMLQAISGGLELLHRRVEQGRGAEAVRLVEGARQTVARAAALTNRLLVFARRQTLQAKPVNADKLILGMEELVRRTVGPAIAAELRMGDGIWPVLCDPNQLESVLLNLAINARDAMTEGGRLTVTTRHVRLSDADVAGQDRAKPGDFVEIAVADTGTGMDEATRARAFEPFFTTKPLGQGTGLGLSQLYGFVQQSDGMVRLDSTPGQGTTMRLYLPRHEHAEGQEEPRARETAPKGAGRGETVLLIEDEAGVRAVAAEHLRDLGYVVLEAGDGPTALRLLHTGTRVDVLVTDVGLPGGMNGRHIADAAREHWPGLPALFITGYAGDALKSRLAPGMEVIGKPFALDALAARVRAMLEAAPAT